MANPRTTGDIGSPCVDGRCHRYHRITATLLATTLLSLCACTGQPLQRHYTAPTTPCCAALADVPFKPLPLGQEEEVSLAPTSPTLALHGRRGHVAGFSIPAGFVPSAISVKSYLSTGFLPNATAVAPELHFFNAQMQPLATVTVTDMQSESGFWRSAVSGRVTVPSDTRYIVLTAGTGDGWRAMVRSENGTRYYLPPAALGDVSVRLFGERVAF